MGFTTSGMWGVFFMLKGRRLCGFAIERLDEELFREGLSCRL